MPCPAGSSTPESGPRSRGHSWLSPSPCISSPWRCEVTATRRHLPKSRASQTTGFVIGDSALKGYVTIGMYEDGSPGEVFIQASKSGSTIQGCLDGMAIMISHSLQYGVPLGEVVDALKGMRFEPMGMTNDADVPEALSVCDYIASKLEHDFKQFL